MVEVADDDAAAPGGEDGFGALRVRACLRVRASVCVCARQFCDGFVALLPCCWGAPFGSIAAATFYRRVSSPPAICSAVLLFARHPLLLLSAALSRVSPLLLHAGKRPLGGGVSANASQDLSALGDAGSQLLLDGGASTASAPGGAAGVGGSAVAGPGGKGGSSVTFAAASSPAGPSGGAAGSLPGSRPTTAAGGGAALGGAGAGSYAAVLYASHGTVPGYGAGATPIYTEAELPFLTPAQLRGIPPAAAAPVASMVGAGAAALAAAAGRYGPVGGLAGFSGGVLFTGGAVAGGSALGGGGGSASSSGMGVGPRGVGVGVGAASSSSSAASGPGGVSGGITGGGGAGAGGPLAHALSSRHPDAVLDALVTLTISETDTTMTLAVPSARVLQDTNEFRRVR
jgi:hypothetical protein